MKKVIIFDFDFTLGDSAEGIIASVNYALKKMGHAEAEGYAIRKTIGLSLAKTYETLTGRENKEEEAVFEKFFKEKADEIMVGHTVLYGGVADLLGQIHEKGLNVAIVTTKYHYRIEGILAANGIRHLVDGIVGGDDVEQAKPDPEGIRKVGAQFGACREEILYVGDSVVDAEAARAAGVDFVAVLTGTTAAGDFGRYPYVRILNSVSELGAYI